MARQHYSRAGRTQEPSISEIPVFPENEWLIYGGFQSEKLVVISQNRIFEVVQRQLQVRCPNT